MTKILNAKGRPFSWSFSRLNDFENCPKKYAEASFYCTAPYVQTPEGAWGDRVHKAAEMFMKGVPHKDEEALLPVEPYCTQIIRSGCRTEAELEIALTSDLHLTNWFSGAAWLRTKIDLIVEISKTVSSVVDWKGLDLDTEIPTPNGWTTMRLLREGDEVFSASGKPCKVVGKSSVHYKKCYRVIFKDKSTVVCDHDHRWVAAPQDKPLGVYTTDKLKDIKDSGKCIYVNTTKPVMYNGNADTLFIHPYILGCWLGDGKHTSGEITKDNRDLFIEIEKAGMLCGGDISSSVRCQCRTVYGLRTLLVKEKLICNKHIPRKYMESSYENRVALVQGLFDTDGTWNKVRNQAVFTTVNEAFADSVVELLSSLGQKPAKFAIDGFGFGKPVKSFDVAFTPNLFNPFRAHRHKQTVDSFKGTVCSTRKYIRSIEEIPTVPTQCISVDSVDNTYLCTRNFIPTHNTGKTIKHDQDQLRLAAAVLNILRPHIKQYKGAYIWTQHKKVVPIDPIDASECPAIWEGFIARVHRMEEAWRLERFPARPSGLCPWCPSPNCASRRGERRG